MIFQNRMKLFSFSLNIFYGNFIELTSEFRKIEDPEMGFFLVQEKNRDKWDQQHREINRRIHNFLTSAFTLVDHTRNFIKKHYNLSSVQRRYQQKIDSEIKTTRSVYLLRICGTT